MNVLEQLPRDYRDMLQIFAEEEVTYLLVGGWAVGVHGHSRATRDLDLFVAANADNAPRVVRALQRFGAPLHGLTAADFAVPGVILQVGVALRIDVTTAIDGVDFDEAARDKLELDVDGIRIFVIGRDALVKNKLATGRPQDRIDVERLERAEQKRRK